MLPITKIAQQPIWLRDRVFTDKNAGEVCLTPDESLHSGLICTKVNDIDANSE